MTTYTRPWTDPAHSRPWPIPPAAADDGSVTFHHLTDTHIDYRPWSRDEMGHMLRDIQDERIPPVHGVVFTGDLADKAPYPDLYSQAWLTAAGKDKELLLCAGNHDIRERQPATRQAWESALGRPANNYVDLAGWRFVTCAPDVHTLNQPWVISPATWAWMDTVVAAAPGPVLIANHFPLQQIGTSSPNCIEPVATAAEFISAHPNIVGWVAGHLHPELGDARTRMFVNIGNRTNFPTLMGISAMLSISGLSRDQSAQIPSISGYVTMHQDRPLWEIRYRLHGPHTWGGPGGYRRMLMHLDTGVVEPSM